MLGLTIVLSSHSLAIQNNPNPNNQNSQFNNQIKGNRELEIGGLYIHPDDLKYIESTIWMPNLQTILSLRSEIFIFGEKTYIYKLIYYINEFLNSHRDDRIIAKVKVPLSY